MSKYTTEKNILILISLLKQHGIKEIIASPGTTNISFVASVQSDPFFHVTSCVDERSAAYMACGIAAEKQEPVVITCTGATASRNYAPGLTEAYYRKLPVIAITATQHLGRVGQNVPQVINRETQFADMVKKSIQLYEVHTAEDAWACNLNINDAILETKNNGGGPVHINMVTTYSNDFSIHELPKERIIERINSSSVFPKMPSSNVAVYIGAHNVFSKKEEELIEEFCEKYNGVVLCDHPSNYNGKYKILPNLVTMQPTFSTLANIELLIDLGEVSGIYANLHPKNVWRVNEDGIVKDTFKKMTKIFAMSEISFFEKYNSLSADRKETTYYNRWAEKRKVLEEKLQQKELPFSNPWIARQIAPKIKDTDRVHLAILNTLRAWDLCEVPAKAKFFSNTGGFGIDGIMSTALGNSLATDSNVYCFIGDLAFFYDLNSIGNKNLPNNLRILLVNNGCGTEFHNFNHRAVTVSKQNSLSPEFFAADGHYGNKSKELVKKYAECLGFEYISASNKKEFSKNVDAFTAQPQNKPILFEVFTNEKDESDALELIYNLESDAKSVAKKLLGEKGKSFVKKIIGK